jgi:hypothetical protein
MYLRAYEKVAENGHFDRLFSALYCEGSGRGELQQQQLPSLGRKGTLPYTLACTVKAQGEPDVTSKDQERRGEKEGCPLPEVGSLAAHVGYVPCVSICLY